MGREVEGYHRLVLHINIFTITLFYPEYFPYTPARILANPMTQTLRAWLASTLPPDLFTRWWPAKRSIVSEKTHCYGL